MESTTFVDPDSLFEHFKNHGTVVGPRKAPNRPTHSQKELYNLRQYLTTLAADGQLSHPIRVEKGEKPGYVLTDGTQSTWGLEVTEATTEHLQRELTETEGDEFVVHLLERDGFVGDSPEHEACAAILRAMRRKARKIRKGGYRPLPRQDLLVYVNVRAFFYNGHKVMDLLVQRISRFLGQ